MFVSPNKALACLLVMILPFSILASNFRIGAIHTRPRRSLAFMATTKTEESPSPSATMTKKRHWQKVRLGTNDGSMANSQRLKMSEGRSKEEEPSRTVPLYRAEGLIAVHKPLTWTSNDVVAYIRGILTRDARNRGADENSSGDNGKSGNKRNEFKKRKGRKQLLKVGHGGTLDPLASGVLVLGIGSGTTKLQSYLEGDKHYVAVVELGLETTTLDSEGDVVKEASWGHIESIEATHEGIDDKTTVEGVLSKFRGKIDQVPPLFSAVRVDGKRLYEYAREKNDVHANENKNAKDAGDVITSDSASHEIVDIPVRKVEVYEIKAGSTLEEDVVHSGIVDGRKYRDAVSSMKAAETETAADDDECTDRYDETGKKDGRKNDKRKHKDKEKGLFNEETVPKIEVDDVSLSLPRFALHVQCGGGTYIRSLVRDIGCELGTVATMTGLVRTKQGPFVLVDALRKEDWTADKIYEEVMKNNRENGFA
mmetsp:Transcript_3035/g.6079  ORF Transcript_3035/g.6079 Transcript_3035/m.6079 type:complete len:481 (-) Transcript_3035:78-1520(-)